MQIDDTLFTCELEDILDELQSQLAANDIPYLQKGYKRSGNSLQIQCPYHGNGQERNRSAGIRRSDGMFHCFACNEVHTLPEFISACFQKTDSIGVFGWRWLRKNFMSLDIEERKNIQFDLDRNVKIKKTPQYVTEEELDGYRYYHPYWKERKITDEYIIELFDLGYDDKTKCITMPVRDRSGGCLFVARRSVKTKWFNYPEGVEKPLYGLYELTEQQERYEEVIVCESMIDALTAWQYGKYAVALNGTGNNLQFRQLKELTCRKLILATDNDEAGQKARERIRQKVTNKIITEYALPAGKKDINELTQKEFENLLEIF